MFKFGIFVKNSQNKNRLFAKKRRFLLDVLRKLFSFEAVAAGAAFRVATASVAYVDFSQRAIIARTVVLTFGYSATDCSVDFLTFFIHHIKKPPSKVKAVYANSAKIIDIFENFL